ncbi:MAG: type II secretion system protein [Verrucomicrobiota bacterium]
MTVSGAKSNAFTLLELVIAMALAMIILGLGAGLAFSTFSQEKQIQRAAGKVEASARKTGMLAQSNRSDQILVLYQDKLVGDYLEESIGVGQLYFARANDSQWQSPSSEGYAWKFSHSGLSEPLRIQIRFESGQVEMAFDPLTHSPKERSIIIDG